MTRDTLATAPSAESQPTRLFIHMAMQFLLAVRHRKHVIIATLGLAGLGGAAYYITAPRYYRATAGMLMIQTGIDNLEMSMTGPAADQRSLMKTFENVAQSPRVVEGALKKLRPEDRVDVQGISPKGWAGTLKRNLSANSIPSTNILEISYLSKDPEVAVNVVNAVIDSYLEFLDDTHKGTTSEVRDLFTHQLAEVGQELNQKEQELIRARIRCGLLRSGDGNEFLDPVTKRAIFFTDELSSVQRRRIELQATLATVQIAVRNKQDLRQHVITVADAVGKEIMLRSFGLSGRDGQNQTALEEQLLADRAELKAMQTFVGPAHPLMIDKQEKIRLAEEYLDQYAQRSAEKMAHLQDTQLGPLLVQMLQQKLHETFQQETSLRGQSEIAQAQATGRVGDLARLEVLERHAKRLHDLSDVLINKIASVEMKEDGQEVRASVTAPPMPNGRPVSPRLSVVVLISLFLGLGSGFAIVYVLDVLDDRFRNIEDMQQQLGVPVLSLIRRLVTPQTTGLEALQLHVAPRSTESEAFRTLRTALALADKDLHRIVVTSAEPGDGKTTVLSNLGVCYAQSNKRTLVIDADLRRPGLTDLMQMRRAEGLSTLLRSDEKVVDQCLGLIRPSGIEKLDVLPSGPRPTNPAELLAGPRFTELIDWATTVYDQILIDTPPTLATSDSAVVGRLADGTILVVQPQKNRRRAVIRAVEGMLALKIPLLGLVVNRVEPDERSGYYGYGYGYGYEAGYGNDEEPGESDAESSSAPNWEELSNLPTSDSNRVPEGIVPRRAA
ncbi:MAG: polysaccharide biosynthesis tyrosine autokinase [Pirellulales bacterium]|nr:polysaccharide biosynthesis tyrosine autokinase [Pirellulales bacterium]